MDIKLQKDNGLELTRKIKAEHPDIVVAILTQYNKAEYLEAAHRSGADFFIPKSFPDKKKIKHVLESIYPQKT